MIGDLTDRLRNAAVSTDDKELYGIAAHELRNQTVDIGLMAKAFADANGNEPQAQALYIRMRVVELIAKRDAIKRQMRAEELKMQQLRQQEDMDRQAAKQIEVQREWERIEQARLDALPKGWNELPAGNKFMVIILAVATVAFFWWLFTFSIANNLRISIW